MHTGIDEEGGGEIGHAPSIAFLRDPSSDTFAFLRGRVFPRNAENGRMSTPTSTTPEERRKALQEWVTFLKAGGRITSRSNWCALADASESAVREFLSGRNDSLNERTYQKLATFAGVRPDDLRVLPPTDQPQNTEGDEEIRQLLKIYAGLDPERRERLQANARDLLLAQKATEQSPKDASDSKD